MIEIIGKVLLGLGLMFTGIQMLSSGLKHIGSRPFRMLAVRFVSSGRRSVVFGLGSGMILQSTSAALVILASLISAGALGVPQAIAILSGFSIGNCVLLFIISLNIAIPIMFLVGICGISMYLAKDEKYRNFFQIGLGLALIFFGIQMMSAGVKPLREEDWFTGTMAFSSNYPMLSIIAGMALGFISQSSTAVAMVAIGLAKENILTGPQPLLLIYGAAIGSTLFKVLLGQGFRGASRQLVRFVNMFNIFGSSVFILLYYIEVNLHVPLLIALLNTLNISIVNQTAVVFLLLNLTSAIFFLIINGPLTKWLAKALPPSEEEELSQTRYLSEFKIDDPDTGLEMIRLEQIRELDHIGAFISTARENYTGTNLASRYDAYKSLSREVAMSATDVAAMTMQPPTAKDHAYIQTRQALLDQLADSAVAVVKTIIQSREHPLLKGLSDSCLESVDFLINLAAETSKTNDLEDIRVFLVLSSGNGPSIEKLRKIYMENENSGAGNDKACLLDLTMATERIIWLLNRLVSLKPSIVI
jgi:phosphate:Na+ symporter